jgi:Phage capsid protein
MGPITDAHLLTFQKNIELAVQQKTSKLENAFTFQGGLSGRNMMMLELIGSTEAVENLGRGADTPDIENAVEPVWIAPHQHVWGKIMELEDTIKAMTNFNSEFVQAGAAAMVRRKDRRLKTAIFGARVIGKDGATTSAWAGSTVAAGIGSTDDATAIGFNVRKIIRAKRYLQEAQVEIDEEELFCTANAKEMEDLYRDLTYINKDYRDKAVLDGKQVREILDVKIIPADGAAAQADYDGTTSVVALWCKSGMRWGPFSPLRSEAPLRADKLNRPHPHMEEWLGATRTEDVKAVKILNKKT